jgi:Big-like domain-containing protein
VSRPALLLSLLVLFGCSDLSTGAGGVVGLEITTPQLLTLEVGETLPLTARALDKDGQTVATEISWRAPDPTLTVDPLTGVVTGVSPGTGRVQAFAGSLASSLVQFTVVARADTLIVTDSVLTVAPLVAASAPLVATLQSLTSGPVADRPLIYVVTAPPDLGAPTVLLPNGALADTVNTGTDGAVSSVTLNRVSGLAQPDTAIVEVRAFHPSGAAVPGSGQRFIVLFQ